MGNAPVKSSVVHAERTAGWHGDETNMRTHTHAGSHKPYPGIRTAAEALGTPAHGWKWVAGVSLALAAAAVALAVVALIRASSQSGPSTHTLTHTQTLTQHTNTFAFGRAAVSTIVYLDGEGNATAISGDTGCVVASLPAANASAVIAAAIESLPLTSGGGVLLRAGVYPIHTPVHIRRSGVTLQGEGAGGDLFFSADGAYHGIANKSAVVLVAEGIDAIVIGADALVFGVTVRDITISGIDPRRWPVSDRMYSNGSGIRAVSVDGLMLTNLFVFRKEYGVNIGTEAAFAWDRVTDVVHVTNAHFSYNVVGLLAHHWVCNVRVSNLWGYLNQQALLRTSTHGLGQYDWIVSGVSSQGDGWANTLATRSAVLDIETSQDFVLDDVTISALYRNTLGQQPLIRLQLARAGAAADEWYRGHVMGRNWRLFSGGMEAIRVSGHGMVDLSNVHAGSTGSQAFTGGNGSIAGPVVVAEGPNTRVTVRGGFAASLQPKHRWFAGVDIVADVRGFSPYGTIDFPFNDALQSMGLDGVQALPTPGVRYVVRGIPLLLTAVAALGGSEFLSMRVFAGDTLLTARARADMVPLSIGLSVEFEYGTLPPSVQCVGA